MAVIGYYLFRLRVAVALLCITVTIGSFGYWYPAHSRTDGKIIAYMFLPVHRSLSLRFFSSQPADEPDNGKPQAFRNKNLWSIRQWFLDNISHPHPTKAQIEDLVALSGLSRKQVQKRLSDLRTGHTDPYSQRYGRGSHVVTEWFLENRYSPYPDSAQIEKLVAASGLSNPQITGRLKYLRRKLNPPSNDLYTVQRLQNSPDSDESYLHLASETFRAQAKRMGRKQWPPRFISDNGEFDMDGLLAKNSNKKNMERKIYQCTACPRSFKRRSSWVAHEFEVHGFNPTEWTCMPHGIGEVGSACDFCFEPIENLNHFDKHRAFKCLERDRVNRTYRSKRFFVDHVRRFHLQNATEQEKDEYPLLVPSAWERDVERINPNALWCGFCQIELESVHSRMDHVQQHFKNGKDMSDWVPRPPS